MKEEGKKEIKGDTGDKEVVEISPKEFLVTSIISDRTPEGGDKRRYLTRLLPVQQTRSPLPRSRSTETIVRV